MIKLASLQSSYSLVWSHDPALDLPKHVDDESLTPEQNEEARTKTEKERERLLRVARQTGNWSAITKPGEQPTVFTFRQLDDTDRGWIETRIAATDDRPALGLGEIQHLVFRYAIERIDNCPGLEVKRKKGERLADIEVVKRLSGLNQFITDGCAMLMAEFYILVSGLARGAVDPL